MKFTYYYYMLMFFACYIIIINSAKPVSSNHKKKQMGFDYYDYDDDYYKDDDDDDDEEEESRSPSSASIVRPRPVSMRGGAEVNNGKVTLSAGSMYQAGTTQTPSTQAPIYKPVLYEAINIQENDIESVPIDNSTSSTPSIIYIKTPPSPTKTVVYVLVPQGHFAYNSEVRVVPYTSGSKLNVVSTTDTPITTTHKSSIMLQIRGKKQEEGDKTSTTTTPHPDDDLSKQSEISEAADSAGGILGYLPNSFRRLLNSFLAVTRRKNYNFFNIFVNSNLYNA